MGTHALVPTGLLGTTGLTVSRLGLGSSAFRDGEAQDWVPLVERAVDAGITYYDTARSYVNGEAVIGMVNNDVRSRMVITTKTTQSQSATSTGGMFPNHREMSSRDPAADWLESKSPSTMYLKGHGLREFSNVAASVSRMPPRVGNRCGRK